MAEIWHLEWPHGALDVHAKGGMLGGVALKRGDRQVRPFYEPPWIGNSTHQQPELLNHMRSEFPCVPFGVPYAPETVVESWQESLTRSVAEPDALLGSSDDLLHGYGCVTDWTLVRQTEFEIEIELEYPDASPIARLARVIRADPKSPAIDFSLKIEARKKTHRPIGLHPNLALPSIAGAFHIDPGAFRFGVVHPAGPEPGVSRAMPAAFFDRLDQVPLRDGGTAEFDSFPFPEDTEEIIQLCGVDGSVIVTDNESRVVYRLCWDASVLPSLLLWISNRGRSYSPWNSRNLCLGIEPVASAFELGCHAALASNPINDRGVSTAVALDPNLPLQIAYRFEVLTQ